MENQIELEKLVDATVNWFDKRLEEYNIPKNKREKFRDSITKKITEELNKPPFGRIYLNCTDRLTGILLAASIDADITEKENPIHGSFLIDGKSLRFSIGIHTQYQGRPELG